MWCMYVWVCVCEVCVCVCGCVGVCVFVVCVYLLVQIINIRRTLFYICLRYEK